VVTNNAPSLQSEQTLVVREHEAAPEWGVELNLQDSNGTVWASTVPGYKDLLTKAALSRGLDDTTERNRSRTSCSIN
jgi:hypothetical protein